VVLTSIWRLKFPPRLVSELKTFVSVSVLEVWSQSWESALGLGLSLEGLIWVLRICSRTWSQSWRFGLTIHLENLLLLSEGLVSFNIIDILCFCLTIHKRRQFYLYCEWNGRPFLDKCILIITNTLPHHTGLAQWISKLTQTLLVLNLKPDLLTASLTQYWTCIADSTVAKENIFETQNSLTNWESSFLIVHQHYIGYSVPGKVW